MKKIFLLIAVALIVSETLSAQNTLQNQFGNQFGGSASGTGSNLYDRNGNPIDTTSVIDASTIPIGLFSWTIDKRFGNMTTIPIDTLQTGFQNSNDVGGMTGHYSALGNLGAPRISHVFFEREDPSQLFFTDPYSQNFIRPDNVVFTNTKSPFTNLTYYKQEAAATVRNASRLILP